MNERELEALNMLLITAKGLEAMHSIVEQSPRPGDFLRLSFEAGARQLLSSWEYLNGGDLPEWYGKALEAIKGKGGNE